MGEGNDIFIAEVESKPDIKKSIIKTCSMKFTHITFFLLVLRHPDLDEGGGLVLLGLVQELQRLNRPLGKLSHVILERQREKNLT